MSRTKKPAIARLVLNRYLFDGIAAGYLASVVVVLFSWWWIFDLFSHFRTQYVLTGFLILPFLLWLKKYWVAGIVTAAISFHTVALWPYLQASRVIAGPDLPSHLTVMFANTYYKGPQIKMIEDVITVNKPDVIIFSELSNKDFEIMKEILSNDYAFYQFEEGEGAYDISYFSKLRPESVQALEFTANNPSLLLQFEWQGKILNVLGMHPRSPVGSIATRIRDEHLVAALGYVSNLTQPTVVIGDFNISQFSPKFHYWLKENNLIDTQLEFGLQPSWSANHLPLFRIPIDQVVVTEGVDVLDRYLGEDIGSDHFPVIVKINLK